MLEELPNVTRLSKRVIRILGLNPSTPTLQGTNTYLIGTGKERILLDTGEGLEGYKELVGSVLGKENATISKVLLSHWHLDHTGGVNSIPKSDSSRIYKFPCNHDLNFDYEPLENDQIFSLSSKAETDSSKVITTTIQVKYTPGHTLDHCSFVLLEENVLFSADCILGSGSSCVFENLTSYMNSLESLSLLQIGKIFPGHGEIIENGHEKVNEYIKHRKERENQILKLFSAGASLGVDDIIQAIYSKLSKELQRVAKVPIQKHLDKLLDENRIILIDGDDRYVLCS